MAETPEHDEFQRIVDGLEQLPTQEQVLRVWAAQQAVAILRGKAAPFGALSPMDPGSVIVMADWILDGEVYIEAEAEEEEQDQSREEPPAWLDTEGEK